MSVSSWVYVGPYLSIDDPDGIDLDYLKIKNLWVPEGYNQILPQKSPPDEIEILFDWERVNSVDLGNAAQLIEKQTNWFEKTFKKGISKIKEGYGEDSVKVCWGVVACYS